MKKRIKVTAVSIANDDVTFLGLEGETVLVLARTDPRVEDLVGQVVKGSIKGPITEIAYNEEVKTSLDQISKATKSHIRFFQTNGTREKAVKSKIDKGFELGMYIGKTKYLDCTGLVPMYSWAVKHNMVQGLEKFLERVNKVIKERRHSVRDMITFLSNTNLPITKEGNILAYKAVKNKSPGVYTDIHTGNVHQSVGSVVQMDANLVDLNRLNHCSDGLHIASQGYLTGFRGDSCLIVLIAPEDVYAVPNDTAWKMRVRAYRIVKLLPDSLYKTVLGTQPLDSTPSGNTILNEMVAENFPPIKEIVDIGGKRGSNITVTKVASKATKRNKVTPVKTLDKNESITATAKKLVKADVVKQAVKGRKEIAGEMAIAITKAKSKKRKLELIEELKSFKKKSKVSWETLGIKENILK